MTRSLCQLTEKKKALCSKRREMLVCRLKWLSHLNVVKIMLSIRSISRELISRSCPPIASTAKTQPCPAQQLHRQPVSMRSSPAFAEIWVHLGAYPQSRQMTSGWETIFSQQQTHACTPGSRLLLGRAKGERRRKAGGGKNRPAPLLLCFSFLTNCCSTDPLPW